MKPVGNLAEDRPIAYPIIYTPYSTFVKTFSGSGYGMVFEDTSETCFLYATDEKAETILDALRVFDNTDPDRPHAGDRLFIVWNSTLQKAGLFFKERFVGVVDFKNRVARCRSGYPAPTGNWCKSSHMWEDQIIVGLGTAVETQAG